MQYFRTAFLLILHFSAIAAADIPERLLVEWDGVAHFIRQTPARIQRYDLNQRTWLSEVNLTKIPTAMAADAGGFYIAYGRTVYRYNNNFGGEVFLRNTEQDVHAMFTDGDILLLDHSAGGNGHYTTLNKTSGILLDHESTYTENTHGTVISRAHKRLLGVREGYSPSDLSSVTYSDDGTITDVTDGPYHGDYGFGSRLWIFPDEARIVGSAGVMFSTLDLTYVGSLGDSLTSVTFNGDLPIVLRGNRLQAYNQAFLPVGETTLAAEAHEIVANGTDVIVFTHPAQEIGNVTAQVVALADINAPDRGDPIDPNGLPFKPDAIFRSSGDVILIDNELGILFAWDSDKRAYTTSLSLRANPTVAAYSATLDRVYLAYADKIVTKVEMGIQEPAEEVFTLVPSRVRGMATAGEFLMVQDDSGAWETHRLINASGVETASKDWNHYSRVYDWDPVMRRMYFFRDSSSPNDLHWESYSEDGQFVSSGETPYHGEVSAIPPIFVYDGGNTIILGSGQIYETNGMTQAGSIPNRISSAVWFSQTLYTLFQELGSSYYDVVEMDYTMVQQWTANYGPEAALFLPGGPLRLLDAEDHIIAITQVADIPQFTIMTSDLNVVWSSLSEDQPVWATDVFSESAALIWDAEGRQGQTAAIERFHFESGQWQEVASVDASTGHHELYGLVPGYDYVYRVKINEYMAWKPDPAIVTQNSRGYLASSEYLYSLFDSLTFEEQAGDGSWSAVDVNNYSGSEALMREGLAPFSYINFRATREMNIEEELPVPPSLSFQMDIEWQVPDGVNYPILVYRYTGNPIQFFELYSTLASDQRTLSIQSVDPIAFPELHFYADRPYPASDLVLNAAYTFTTKAQWNAVAGAEVYKVYHQGENKNVAETSVEVTQTIDPYPQSLFTIEFPSLEVRAITGTQLESITSWNRIKTTLSVNGSSYGTRLIQQRLSPEAPWEDLQTVTYFPAQLTFDGNTVPEYRLLARETVPQSILGAVTFRTAQPDGLDRFDGSISTDINGNRYVNWLGHYHAPANPDWIYSFDFGWMYITPANQTSWWIWTWELGWTCWNSELQSVFYRPEHAKWYFHWQGSSWSYDFAAGQYLELM